MSVSLYPYYWSQTLQFVYTALKKDWQHFITIIGLWTKEGKKQQQKSKLKIII